MAKDQMNGTTPPLKKMEDFDPKMSEGPVPKALPGSNVAGSRKPRDYAADMGESNDQDNFPAPKRSEN